MNASLLIVPKGHVPVTQLPRSIAVTLRKQLLRGNRDIDHINSKNDLIKRKSNAVILVVLVDIHTT